jgi:hypothetical protein
LESFFVDDTNQGKGTHYKYGREDIDYMIKQAQLQFGRLDIERYKSGRGNQHKTTWLLYALLLHPIRYCIAASARNSHHFIYEILLDQEQTRRRVWQHGALV